MSHLPKVILRVAVIALAATALSLPTTGGAAAAIPVHDNTAAVAQAPALSAAAQAEMRQFRRSVCVNAHVQNIGWQGWRCSRNGSVFAGTTGMSLRLEALSIVTRGTYGVCAQAHVQNVGWQQHRCAGSGEAVSVGTVGQSLRMEGLRLSTRTGVCARGHVQYLGWQRWTCSRNSWQIMIGTVGQSLRLEALNVRV